MQTKEEGIKKSKNFADIINGCPFVAGTSHFKVNKSYSTTASPTLYQEDEGGGEWISSREKCHWLQTQFVKDFGETHGSPKIQT